jgi:TonB family protein
MTSLWLRNLVAVSMQAALLTLVGATLARVLRIQSPRAALGYWRALLAACIVLPFCQPWTVPAVPSVVPSFTGTAGDALVAAATGIHTATPSWRPSVDAVMLALVSGGIAARAMWLALGVWTLRRIRREASPLEPLPEVYQRAQHRVGARAAMFVSGRIAGPITFGLRRPVIVFPPAVAVMEESIQHAIACHELLHVRRRDWVFEVLEECLRTVLWFHPGIWWLISRVQLSREQVVDHTAIRLTESRNGYVEALLAVAVAKSPGILTPASAFLRHSVLKKRVALIFQESAMTTRRLLLSLAASAAALLLAATLAGRSFPLEAREQPAPAGGGPVQIVKGGEHLIHGDVPEYPHRAIERRVEGDVVLDLAVDDRGEVSDARVLSGPDEFRKAALEAVLGWHYSPSAVRSMSIQATLRFHVPPPETEADRAKLRYKVFAMKSNEDGNAGRMMEIEPERAVAFKIREVERGEPVSEQQTEHLIEELKHAITDSETSTAQREELKAKLHMTMEGLAKQEALRQNPEMREKVERSAGPLRLAHVKTERVSDEAVNEVMARVGLKIGDTVTEDSLKRLRAAASDVDEHLHVEFANDGNGSLTVMMISR